MWFGRDCQEGDGSAHWVYSERWKVSIFMLIKPQAAPHEIISHKECMHGGGMLTSEEQWQTQIDLLARAASDICKTCLPWPSTSLFIDLLFHQSTDFADDSPVSKTCASMQRRQATEMDAVHTLLMPYKQNPGSCSSRSKSVKSNPRQCIAHHFFPRYHPWWMPFKYLSVLEDIGLLSNHKEQHDESLFTDVGCKARSTSHNVASSMAHSDGQSNWIKLRWLGASRRLLLFDMSFRCAASVHLAWLKGLTDTHSYFMWHYRLWCQRVTGRTRKRVLECLMTNTAIISGFQGDTARKWICFCLTRY